jgi:signal transduction histidine kinase
MEESEQIHRDLDQILQCAQRAFQFHAGVLYYADMETETLIAGANVNCIPRSNQPPPRFEFSARALISKAFRDGEPAFSENPIEDVQNVSREGLEYYGIKGPLLAVPLIIPDSPPVKVGSLAVFNRGPGGPDLRSLGDRIEPFAQFAARMVARLRGQRQTIASFKRLAEILRGVRESGTELETLRLVLNGLCDAASDGIGFDRVRAFSYDATEKSFRPFDSVGMPDPEEFRRFKAVSAVTNPYSKFTVENLEKERGARQYGPTTAHDFGVDFDGVELGKLPESPWAVVPLVFGSECLGQIVADNVLTRRKITTASEEFLDAVGAGISGVIAGVRAAEDRRRIEEGNGEHSRLSADREVSLPQRMSRIFQPHLETLYEMTAGSVPWRTVVRRLLVFATCGETLSFHRAIFLRYQKDRRGGQDAARMTFEECIGSLDEARFNTVSQIASRSRFRDLLDRAGREGEMRDEDLEDKLRDLDLWVEEDSAVMSLLSRNKGAELLEPGPSHLADMLQRKIGLKGKPFRALAAIVRLPGGDPVGMLIVDRVFKNEHLTSKEDLTSIDLLLLEILAIHAGTIFQQNTLWSRIRKAESDLEWKWAAFAMRHGISTPTAAIDSAVNFLLKPLADSTPHASPNSLDRSGKEIPVPPEWTTEAGLRGVDTRLRRIQKAVRGIKDVLDQFQELAMLDSPEKFIPVPLAALLAELEKPAGVDFRILGSLEGIKVPCSRPHLVLILKELVTNAEHSFDSGARDKRIRIQVRRSSASSFAESLSGKTAGFAVVSVEDNGRGILAEEMDRIWELNWTTRDKSGGTGYGLWFLKYVVEKHGGRVHVESNPAYGTTFVLYLPLAG